MRFLKLGLVGIAFAASSAFAAPIVWTVPPTGLPGGTTIGGTFTYDTATSTFSNINLTSTGSQAGTFTFGNVILPGDTLFVQQTATVTGAGELGAWINFNGLPAAGGSFNLPTIGVLSCQGASGGLCTNGVGLGDTSNVTITGAAPVVASPTAVPTLSEYGMLALSSLIAMCGIWSLRKRGKV